MQLTINTEQPLTEQERQILELLLPARSQPTLPFTEPEPEPEKKAEPEPELTREQLTTKATELIAANDRDKVKAALGSAGASRVSDLQPHQYAAFWSALHA